MEGACFSTTTTNTRETNRGKALPNSEPQGDPQGQRASSRKIYKKCVILNPDGAKRIYKPAAISFFPLLAPGEDGCGWKAALE
ncbi:hypothetical protein MPNT_500002 [Candidatus Methylacidithermus pantelleriae]|uniref:Uncharacterized protein n=1 Tax=Candidatus Methylacidithermus pantelleriae TaxID=2744239 RepID=A0A8J2FT68_9BACT|nr:hypothetical protein MPNT_500002 [Candidatus Methylacidithermus pantelleriae]